MSEGFFNDLELWKKEWKDMPEFIHKNLEPFRSILVHFEKPEDVTAFAKLVKQNITGQTKWIWFPYMPKRSQTDHIWVDEEDDES
jgi:hypothetical protein